MRSFEEKVILILSMVRKKPVGITRIRTLLSINNDCWIRYLDHIRSNGYVTMNVKGKIMGRVTSRTLSITDEGRKFLKNNGVRF